MPVFARIIDRHVEPQFTHAMDDDITLTDEDEGKDVKNASGENIGKIVEVEHGTAHIDPDPGITDDILSTLGWGDSDEDTYELDSDQVESVTDDEVHLER